jgi:hypothetical protein
MKKRPRPAIYVLLGLGLIAVLTAVVLASRHGSGRATSIDPYRVETCLQSSDGVVEWLNNPLEDGVEASRGGYQVVFGSSVSFVVAFSNTVSEAKTLQKAVRETTVYNDDPEDVRRRGTVVFWGGSGKEDYRWKDVAFCINSAQGR